MIYHVTLNQDNSNHGDRLDWFNSFDYYSSRRIVKEDERYYMTVLVDGERHDFVYEYDDVGIYIVSATRWVWESDNSRSSSYKRKKLEEATKKVKKWQKMVYGYEKTIYPRRRRR